MDRREQILNRLFDVLKTIPGVKQWVRNRAELPNEDRPAITQMDADETANPNAFQKGRIGVSPSLVTCTPEIYVVLDDRKPDNLNVGQDLNAFRVLIVKAVRDDATLKSLVGSNGEIRYNGCNTDLGRDRNLVGEMLISLSFVYPFIPSEL
jgi:hypothetical protein